MVTIDFHLASRAPQLAMSSASSPPPTDPIRPFGVNLEAIAAVLARATVDIVTPPRVCRDDNHIRATPLLFRNTGRPLHERPLPFFRRRKSTAVLLKSCKGRSKCLDLGSGSDLTCLLLRLPLNIGDESLTKENGGTQEH